MQLLKVIQHLTFITSDMDRLIAFYDRVFEAKTVCDMEEEGLRHAFIAVGANTLLHPFQIPGIEPPSEQPIFQRGRLDHLALNAVSKEAFYELRRRLLAEGATNGEVINMGPVWVLTFSDPDQGSHEVVWENPQVTMADSRMRADWTVVEIE
jgi:catechol 2,3-dioxygenase-like lactoylglutathione lyase family enzyme